MHVTTVPMSLRFLAGQVGYMQRNGFHVHAISSPGSELNDFAAAEGVDIHAVQMSRAITPATDLVATARLSAMLRDLRPDIVHAHTPKAGLLSMVAATIARVPIRLYHMRGLPHMTARGWRRRVLALCEQISCGLADRVVCVSHSLAAVAIEQRLCAREKLVVLGHGSGNGVDAENRYNPLNLPQGTRARVRQDLGIPPDAVVVGFVGRLVRDKGVMDLANAWMRLREDHPHAYLLLIGPEEARDSLPPTIMPRLSADLRVRVLGAQWNTPPLYAVMDVAVLPSYREGFPNVPLEAAAMELPVVATRIPGCVDAISDGLTGTLVPVGDATELAVALSRYLSDPALRRHHGAAGRTRAINLFRPALIWESLRELYLEVACERGLDPAPARRQC